MPEPNWTSDKSTIGSSHSDEYLLGRIRHYTIGLGDLTEEIDFLTWISDDCGWNPLTLNEKMTVTIAGKTYDITRTS